MLFFKNCRIVYGCRLIFDKGVIKGSKGVKSSLDSLRILVGSEFMITTKDVRPFRAFDSRILYVIY